LIPSKTQCWLKLEMNKKNRFCASNLKIIHYLIKLGKKVLPCIDRCKNKLINHPIIKKLFFAFSLSLVVHVLLFGVIKIRTPYDLA